MADGYVFPVTDDQHARLKKMQIATEVNSASEVVENALAFYEYIVIYHMRHKSKTVRVVTRDDLNEVDVSMVPEE